MSYIDASFIPVSQVIPVYPAPHAQEYMSGRGEEQVASFWHGLLLHSLRSENMLQWVIIKKKVYIKVVCICESMCAFMMRFKFNGERSRFSLRSRF